MPELVRVDDRPDRSDLALVDLERHDADQAVVGVEDLDSGLAVDRDATEMRAAEARRRARPRHQRPGDPCAAVHRPGECGRLAATVAVQGDIVGKQSLEPLELALLDRREEPAREPLALVARGLEPRPAFADLPPRADGQLA